MQPPQPGSVGHREEMNITFPQLGHFKNTHRAELQVCKAFFSTKKSWAGARGSHLEKRHTLHHIQVATEGCLLRCSSGLAHLKYTCVFFQVSKTLKIFLLKKMENQYSVNIFKKATNVSFITMILSSPVNEVNHT